ncbi:MAG TPA: SDR family oxidoreductase [Hyphomonadaceae bacterium]|nr:SDR family oxidoreductase [Hyphomonadaceae bacterium]
MKVVVIGGSGLIGSKLVSRLRDCGHEVVAASPNTGVNTLTGKGLKEALKGAEVVVDVSNSPTLDGKAAQEFFEKSGRNLLAAEKAAGVKHHVALSIVGSHRVTDSAYLQAKAAQEDMIAAASIPYTIVESTQFFEFIERIAKGSEVDGAYRLSPALMQPIAAADVVAALVEATLGAPVNGAIEIGGPEAIPLDELARLVISARGDPHPIIADAQARYFGAVLNDKSLVPGPKARLGAKRFDDWLRQSITAD